MRRFLTALALSAFVFGVPAAVQPSEKVTFSVKYGTLNLGTWDRFATGKSKVGIYDGSTFNSSDGPGFGTITLARRSNAADLKGLFATIKPPNVPLVVQARKKNVVVSTTTCEKAVPSDFGTNGAVGTAPEVLVFACSYFTTVPAKPGPKH